MSSNNNNVTSVDSSEIENALLKELDKNGSVPDTGVFAQAHKWAHDDNLVGAIKRLEALSILLDEFTFYLQYNRCIVCIIVGELRRQDDFESPANTDCLRVTFVGLSNSSCLHNVV
jgi:hypothetical protein